MSLPIYVDAHSGYKANERPSSFELDEVIGEYGPAQPGLRKIRIREVRRAEVRAADGWRLVAHLLTREFSSTRLPILWAAAKYSRMQNHQRMVII